MFAVEVSPSDTPWVHHVGSSVCNVWRTSLPSLFFSWCLDIFSAVFGSGNVSGGRWECHSVILDRPVLSMNVLVYVSPITVYRKVIHKLFVADVLYMVVAEDSARMVEVWEKG